jgi:hypothetical protein
MTRPVRLLLAAVLALPVALGTLPGTAAAQTGTTRPEIVEQNRAGQSQVHRAAVRQNAHRTAARSTTAQTHRR